jgi:endoglucanase
MQILRSAVILCASLDSLGSATPKPGDLVFAVDFDTPAVQQAWPRADFAKWVPGHEGTPSVQITAPPEKTGGRMIALPLDLTPYRGCKLLLECMAKADNVSKPSAEYLGVKFMLHYNSAISGPVWQNENDVHGTFDWRKLRFTSQIAADASDGEISIGLQGSSGTAWFDDVKITVFKGPPPSRPAPMVNPPPAFKGHNLPRLRGVMSPNVFRDEDLRILGNEWKANVIRWQLTRNWGKPGTDRDLLEYDQWLDGKLSDLDKVLEACGRYGIKVVVDMHSPPGGRYANNDLAIFNEPVYQDHWVSLWEKMARRYKGNPVVWGYDLVNEPVQNNPSPPGVADYLGAQVRAAKAIRSIDPDMPIFMEAAEWDSAGGYQELEPIDVPNIIYQVHMYMPGEFTHQGVHGDWKAIPYPGKIGNMHWDKPQLRKALKPVRDFQLAYNVHIYAGEFSAIRWAPGAADYLKDCIDIFEEYGWDWTYHAYREWDGWSVEHGSDPQDHQPAKQPADRKKQLLEWFGKNVKPG